MTAYWRARLRFQVQVWWLILTGRGNLPAPQSLLDAYDSQETLYRRRRS